jgi:acyl carrier protein
LSAERAAAFHEDTPLFGALPELDSLAVAGVLTEIEDRLGILIEDDEVDGEMLESFGALARFAAAKALG